MGLGTMLLEFAFFWVLLMFIVSVHEFSHGWVANKLGDPTAKEAGRLTLNPLAHIDPFGSILLPAVLFFLTGVFFGMAKPVPVNFAQLRRPKRDMIWVGAAGPASNLSMALGAALLSQLFHIWPGTWLGELLRVFILINVILAVFNFIPIPPLDGSRVLIGLLPRHQAITVARLEPYGIFIVMILFFLGVLTPILLPLVRGIWKLIGMEPNWLNQFF